MYRLLAGNFVRSFIDNCIRDCVDEPAYGGIVQCELLFGLTGHSGIYVGNGEIVHLDGDGYVIKSTAKQFLERLSGWNSAISIYTDCIGTTPLGRAKAAKRAKAQVGNHYPYSLADFNCHTFTALCFNGSPSLDIWLARHLKSLQLGNCWRVWNY